MVFEKRQEVQPENVLLGDNAPVEDHNVSEVLFVDMEARERRRDFLHGLMTGAVVALALCLGVILWRGALGRGTGELDVLRQAVDRCGELTKMRSYFESLVDYRQAGSSGRARNFAIMVNGTVESGFDMRKARIEVFMGERRIEVTLPHGRIEKTMVNLAKGSHDSVKTYTQYGNSGTRVFSAKEQSEIMSSAMRTIRRRASSEWGIVSRTEENAARVYSVVLGALSCDVRVNFTDESGKLGMPEGVSGDVMNEGGAFILHANGK